MNRGADQVLPAISHQHALYNTSVASSAASSTVSVWSDASSQSSDDSSTSISSDSDSCDPYSKSTCKVADAPLSLRRPQHHQQRLPPLITDALPAEQRQNPRRSSGAGAQARSARLPSLVRQSDRKVNFVDSLVGM